MPYPLAKLPYGLRCRLSELTTPLERYNLQIAAGGAFICPPKLQNFKGYIENPQFVSENKTVSLYNQWYHEETKIPFAVFENNLILCPVKIKFTNFDAESFKSVVFDHCLFDTGKLFLHDCTLSKSLFEMIKMTVPKITFLYLSARKRLHINFTELLTVFTDLPSIVTDLVISPNWINEILQVKNHSLMKLMLDVGSLTSCCKLNSDEFVTFLKTQRLGFFVQITTITNGDPDLYFAEIQQFLNQKLVPHGFYGSQENITHVVISYNGNNHMWYLPSSQ